MEVASNKDETNPTDSANVGKQKQKQSKKCGKFSKITVFLTIVWLGYFLQKGFQSKNCLLDFPRKMRGLFRPPENCDFCTNVNQVDRVKRISSAVFAKKYAYSGAPVIVEDATNNWTAVEVFTYWFFRDVYLNAKRKQKILNCQFLPYETGFENLFDAFEMLSERVNRENATDNWYLGWSNCSPETAELLRKHYDRLYFLPETSENNAEDWIFMGTSGLGANMHIDNVRLPSWQAQLSGRKRWILAPPPECYFQCKSFQAIVEPGEVIVLDTNKWYHQTIVLPGNLSITIGAEYD